MAEYSGQEPSQSTVTPSHQVPIDIYPSVTKETEISAEVIFNILTHPQRRFVIEHLLQTDTVVPVSELAEQVAGWETNNPIDSLSDADRKQAAIPLRHNHLIKLADAGIIRYDEHDQLVELKATATTLAPYLQLLAVQRNHRRNEENSSD